MNASALACLTLLAFAGYFTISASGSRIRVAPRDVVCETPDGFVLHPDCTLYYQCSNGVPILAECPGGLYFNPGLAQCDFADNVTDCIGGTRDPGTGTEPVPISTTEMPEMTTHAEVTTAEPVKTTAEPELTTADDPITHMTTGIPIETTASSGICPPDGIDYVPYPGDCSKYYICVNGEANELTCAEGTLFDPELKKCNLAEEVDCKTETTQPPTVRPTTEAPGVTCPATGVINIPDPTDCSKYYLCIEGDAIPQECAEGLLFDPVLEKCNLAEEVTCNVEPQCPATGIVYLPVQGTCTEYIMCVNGDSYPQTCAPGTEFNPEEGQCVLDSAYECPFLSRKHH